MLHSIPFERQTAIVLLNGDGKIIKDMTLTNSTKAKTPSELMVEKALFEALEKIPLLLIKRKKGYSFNTSKNKQPILCNLCSSRFS